MKKLIVQKLSSTKKKVSSRWSTYRSKRNKILKNKKLSKFEKKSTIDELLGDTRHIISNDWAKYSESKYGIIHRSPFYDFTLSKRMVGSYYKPVGYKHKEFFRFKNTYQKIYKAKKDFDPDRLNKIVPRLLSDKKVKGVLVVFEVSLTDTGERVMVSDYITSEAWERIQENNQTIYDSVARKFWSTKHYAADLIFIYMRVIYAKNK
jgi:hypothetical protein